MGQPGRLKVLVVDDEDLVPTLLRQRVDGCEVLEAKSVDQAGDILRRTTVDVLVADNICAGHTDRDPLRLCARLQPQARRIMFSGSPPADLQWLLDKEIVHSFVPKPLDDALVRQIDAIITARQGAAVDTWPRRAKPVGRPASTVRDAPVQGPAPTVAPARHFAPPVPDAPARDSAPTLRDLPVVRPRTREAQEVLDKLRGELASLHTRSDIDLLGLQGLTDPTTTARTAFYALSKRYHPDTYGKYGDPEIKQAATEIFILIKGAYTRVLKGGRPTRRR